MFSSVLRDLRIATRSLAGAPGFSVVAIATLAVAVGANTAIFSVVDGVLLRPLAYPDADRLVTVGARVLPQAGGARDTAPFSDRGYWHFVENNRAFATFGGYSGGDARVPLTGDGPPVQVALSLMTASAFELIGVPPQIGRLPLEEEDVPGASSIALISDRLWRSRYGSDPAIVGTTIELNGVAREVIGVMPAGYDFPNPEIDVWGPRQLDPASTNFGGHHLEGIARLAPGITVEAAVSDAESLIARFSEVGYGPEWFQGIFSGEASVVAVKEGVVGDSREPLIILMGTVGFVLLIACSNIANLLLVRAESRTRERAIRVALGSSRRRLIQYVLAESLVLAVAGGTLGMLLAFLGTRALVAAAPASVPRLHEIGMNPTVLGFATLITVGAGLLFGAFPAIRAGSRRTMAALRDGGRGSTIGRDRHRTRGALVVAQVALALVLLVGSGLMVRSFQRLRSVDPGFRAEGVLTFRLTPAPSRYPGGAPRIAQFYDDLVERLEAIPGVTSAGGITALPLSGPGAVQTAMIDEFPPQSGEFPPTFLARRATPGYFETLGIPLVEGRTFTPDDHNGRFGSIIISESVKREFWPETSALGKRIQTFGAPARVVGVVGDVHHDGLHIPAEQFAYKPMLDSIGGGVGPMMMAVRTSADPTGLIPAVREAITELDPELPITSIQTMEEVIADSLSRTTFTMTLLVIAALVALFLGSVGIYGVLSYVATQRTAEMGIRLAVGARPGDIRRLMMSQGLGLAGVGVAIGVAAAVVLGRMMNSLLYGVSATDLVSLVGSAVVFLAVAALASLFPALRAAATPPAVALRAD